MKLEATHLRDNLYAVRPEGALGTCGWIKGEAWNVIYVKGASASAALVAAQRWVGASKKVKA